MSPSSAATWQDWARAQGADEQSPSRSLTLGNYPLVIQAAVAGRGVALGWRPLVDELLRGGQLASPPVPQLATPRGYFLVRPHGRESRPALDSQSAWIAGQCAA